MKNRIKNYKEMKPFLLLWSTQSISQLGSSITGFALTLWLYAQTGSALSAASLTICTYVPYVIMSIFAGALTDKFDKKKTMLICDTLAAVCTIIEMTLLLTGRLAVWHLYLLNAFCGLMNTVQQPASEVAVTLLVPKKYYQTASGLQSFSRSAISILNPLIAAALYSFGGMSLVFIVDLSTFVLAFFTLLLGIKIPKTEATVNEKVLTLAKEGLRYLKDTPLIWYLIIFMSGVNLVASAFDAALPGYVIPNPRGGEQVLGLVTAFSGLAMLAGSMLVPLLPVPKSRVKMVYLTMLFSLGTENFIMPLSRNPLIWCLSQILGWLVVPIMSANLDVIMRDTIPLELQGRVYACRNTFQFFTIPIGLFLGGFLVDDVFEPLMQNAGNMDILKVMFGSGKGSGAGMTIFILGIVGVLMCLVLGKKLKKYFFVK